MEISQLSNLTEIQNLGNYDLLINNRQSTISIEETERLAKSLKNNIANAPDHNPISTWVVSHNNGRIFYDKDNDPNFAAKVKWIHAKHDQLKHAIDIDRTSAPQYEQGYKKRYYANDSLLSEMSLSTKIAKIVSSPEIQNLVKKIGIDSVSVIEPLIGLINRKNGSKTVFYKYSNGERVDKFLEEEQFENWRIFMKRLEKAFQDEGIEPYDLDSRQFLVEKDKDNKHTLRLIDTEMYYKI